MAAKSIEDECKIVPSERLLREFYQLQLDPPPFCSAAPIDDNMYNWEATIKGPPNTPYFEGFFVLNLDLSPDYPYTPPKVAFKTRIFHPNIHNINGSICLEGREWSAGVTISQILLHICSLMTGPDPDDPLVPGIAHVYKNYRVIFERIAQKWTLRYAKQGSIELVPIKVITENSTHSFGVEI